jgi:hypothetical protein
VDQILPVLRSDKSSVRLPLRVGSFSTMGTSSRRSNAARKETLYRAIRAFAPALVAISFVTAAHAQGTMDFSGAQTLMGTFKTFTALVRRADEGTLSRLVVEASILLAASRGNSTVILKEAAASYQVDTDAITTKVRQEFAAKEKAKKATQPAVKSATKAA